MKRQFRVFRWWAMAVLVAIAVLVAVILPGREPFTVRVLDRTNTDSPQSVGLVLSNRSSRTFWVRVECEEPGGDAWSTVYAQQHKLNGVAFRAAQYSFAVTPNKGFELIVVGPEFTPRWRIKISYRQQLEGWQQFVARAFEKIGLAYPFDRLGSKIIDGAK